MRVAAIFAALAVAGCGGSELERSAADPSDGQSASQLALASRELLSIQEGRCGACHGLGGDADAALRPAMAASIESMGRRSGRTSSVHFAGDAADDVAAWMASLGMSAIHFGESDISGGLIAAGERLVAELGCAACHDAAAFDLSQVTTHERLTASLAEPGFPHVPLSRAEAAAVAAYLLRAQVREGERGQGFAWRCFETKRGHGEWPDISTWTPQAKGVTDRVGKHVATRGTNYLLEFTATIEVPATGEWTFAIRSDDGGWIWVDSKPVAENPGMHGATRKQGKLRLTAGPHELRVGFTQGGGGDVLEVFWAGPGVDEQPIPAAAATTAVTKLVHAPRQLEVASDAVVARGREAARAARCDACHPVAEAAFHALPAPSATKPWAALSGTCTVADVAKHAAGVQLPAEVDAATKLHAALVADGCLSCHVRDGVGGLSADVQAQLAEVEDIGQEGVLPPDLSQVGRRLRPEWLERVVRDGHKARDYVLMRMPAFGPDKARQYAQLFAAVDADGVDDAEPQFSEEAAELGRTLAGTGGRNCISCHRVAGRPSLGPQGMDLTAQYERLRPGWFREWLLHPTKLRPNTRMPTLWLRGDERSLKEIESIRTWLSLGTAAPLPTGIVVDSKSMTLDPVERPILHGAFLQGVSARTLMVGTPQRTHFAYDLVEPRLVWLWRGGFVDATGTWVGRAGQLIKPLGEDWRVVDDFSVEGERRIIGQRRTKDGYPVLRVAAGDARYEDVARPRLAAGGSVLIRTIRCVEGALIVQFPELDSYQVTVGDAPVGRHELVAGEELEVVYQW